jgi:hypothetical protein
MRGVVALDPMREAAYRDLIHYALARATDEAVACIASVQRWSRSSVEPEPATADYSTGVPSLLTTDDHRPHRFTSISPQW